MSNSMLYWVLIPTSFDKLTLVSLTPACQYFFNYKFTVDHCMTTATTTVSQHHHMSTHHDYHNHDHQQQQQVATTHEHDGGPQPLTTNNTATMAVVVNCPTTLQAWALLTADDTKPWPSTLMDHSSTTMITTCMTSMMTTTTCLLDINLVVVYLLHYISARAHYSRVHSTTVPSVACQTTEGKYHSTNHSSYILIPCSYLQVHTNIQ